MKVRKARGLNVAGGNRIGNTLGLAEAAGGSKGFIGYAGVPNAGEDEGIGFEAAGVVGTAKKGATRDRGIGLGLLMMNMTSSTNLAETFI